MTMNEIKPLITFHEAMAIAEKDALVNLREFMASDDRTPLDESRFLEAAHCWMFFRNPRIKIPPHARLVDEAAYCISKRGKLAMIQDYSDDPFRLKEYLQTMSSYFGARQE
jgi:hypothetical protein